MAGKFSSRPRPSRPRPGGARRRVGVSIPKVAGPKPSRIHKGSPGSSKKFSAKGVKR